NNQEGGSQANSTTSAKIRIDEVTPYTKKIDLQLSKVVNVDKYVVRYAISSKMKDAKKIEKSSNSFEIRHLENSTTYYLQARAFIHSRWTEWSSVKKVKTA